MVIYEKEGQAMMYGNRECMKTYVLPEMKKRVEDYSKHVGLPVSGIIWMALDEFMKRNAWREKQWAAKAAAKSKF